MELRIHHSPRSQPLMPQPCMSVKDNSVLRLSGSRNIQRRVTGAIYAEGDQQKVSTTTVGNPSLSGLPKGLHSRTKVRHLPRTGGVTSPLRSDISPSTVQGEGSDSCSSFASVDCYNGSAPPPSCCPTTVLLQRSSVRQLLSSENGTALDSGIQCSN